MRAPEAAPEAARVEAAISKIVDGVRYIAIPALDAPQDFDAELVSEAEIVKYLAAARQDIARIQENPIQEEI